MALTAAPSATLADLARALAHHAAGRLADAERGYRAVLVAAPDNADALHLLGALLASRGDARGGLVLVERALALAPGVADFHVSRGVALKAAGVLDEAAASWERALALEPGHADAWNDLGTARVAQGRADEALPCFARALAARPGFVTALANTGLALTVLGRYDEAAARCEEALARVPDDRTARLNLAAARLAAGRVGEAVTAYRAALARRPDDAEAHSGLVFALDFDPATTAAAALAERRRWGARHAAPLITRWRPHDNDRRPERRLRVGYVSADFRRHSAAALFGPVLRHHDPAAVEVICYSGAVVGDETTARFRAGAALWRDVAGLDDEALAARIRADGVDVLVDLSGFSAGHRLGVFAHRPAPVQVTAWGHAVGTGLAAMDYLFADDVTVPPAARAHFTEEIVRLPAIVTYEPPAGAPPPAPLPALGSGRITFGCFNRPAKITDAMLAVWAGILAAVPGSRLLLKFPGFEDAGVQARVRAALTAGGADPARVAFLGGTPPAEHLAAYAQVDVALDPFPHGGGVSALDGLWMGVPMVTLCGERVPARLGASFLTVLGLERFVAGTPAEYAAVARRVAADPSGLAALRAGLRDRVAASPLGNHRAYCRAVEAAYRTMWRRWCAAPGQPSRSK